jgi:dipeptidyl aminopeptidase/acylaminoacyl peptidase
MTGTRDIWIYDLSRGVRTRFTFDPSDELRAIWSPDQSRIVFNSLRRGRLDLYEKASDGSGEEELLLADTFDEFPESWSPDGGSIIYQHNALNGKSIYGSYLFPGTENRFRFCRRHLAKERQLDSLLTGNGSRFGQMRPGETTCTSVVFPDRPESG